MHNLPTEPKRLAWIIPHTLTDTLHASARLGPARALCTLGWSVTLIAVDGKTKVHDPALHIHYIQPAVIKGLRYPLFQSKAVTYVMRHWDQFDIIFFQQVSGLWLMPLATLRFLPVEQRPLLVMDTRDFIDAKAGNAKVWLRRQLVKSAYQTIGRWVDGQTAITTRMATLANIPAEKLWGVWPSGVDLEKFCPALSARRWPARDEAIHLIYTGILLPKRHLLELCKAVEQANAEGMAFVLSLVGKGPEQATLQAFAQESEGRIRLVAPVSHEQVPALLAQAHVGVTSLPTPDDIKYEASSPIKLFEYMAAGLPILATNNACHTDVIQDKTFAFWASSATPEGLLAVLRRLWQQRASLPQLSREATQTASNWTWQASGQKLNEALLQGLTRHRSRLKAYREKTV